MSQNEFFFFLKKECVHALTRQEAATGVEKGEISMEVDLKNLKKFRFGTSNEGIFI